MSPQTLDEQHFKRPPPTKPDPPSPPRKLDLTPDDPHWICISSVVLHWDLYYFLGTEQIDAENGLGGWTQVDRPRDISISTWPGVAGFTMSLPLVIDSWIEDLHTPRRERVKRPPQRFN